MKNGIKAFGFLALLAILASCGTTSSSSAPSSTNAGESSTTSSETSTNSTGETSSVDSSTSSPSSPSTGSSSSAGSGSSVTPPDPEPVTYRIGLTVPTGVTAHLDKTEAEEGESVSVIIDSVSDGYSITSVVLHSYEEEVLTSTDGKTYTFTMPDRTVTITIGVTVEGKITLVGDFAAALTLNPETNIYEARNVKIEGTSEMAVFSYVVEDEDGNKTELDSMAVDEKKCFADISYVFSGEHNLEIASGCTYDFFYDPASPRPCYVRRTSVDVLPSSVNGLYHLFDGNIRSESTCITPDLTGMEMTYTSSSEQKSNTIKMDKYEDGSVYMTVENTLTSASYFTYKKIDQENNLLIVADNYPASAGNDDDTRPSMMNGTAYSARYDIVDTGESTRFTRTLEDAEYELNTTGHQMRFIEDDIMYAYRVGIESEYNDEVSASNVAIASEKTATGFSTTIESFVEYNSTAGTYTDERHEAYVYSVQLDFDVRGALTGLNYVEDHYPQESWNFTTHEPISVVATKTTAKKIIGTWTYSGTLQESLPSDFDPSDYFIQSFDSVHFYDSKTEKPADDGKNYLHYNDKVMVAASSADEDPEHVDVTYSPITALDLWQYAPTESSDDSVITSTIYDTYNQMTCVGIGTATVTLTNHTENSGVHKDVEIEVSATQTFHGFALNANTNPMVTTTTTANIYAGTQETYDVIVTPSDAPCILEAAVDPAYADLLKVVSTDNHQLVLEAAADSDITEPTAVTVSITSPYMNMEVFKDGYTNITITVLPLNQTPYGEWRVTSDDYDTTVSLTQESYTGETLSSSFTAPKMGKVVDNNSYGLDTYYFYYEFRHGQILANVYEIETTGTAFDFEADAVSIELVYDPATDVLSIGMYYTEMAADSFEAYTYALIGDIDDENYLYPTACERVAE